MIVIMGVVFGGSCSGSDRLLCASPSALALGGASSSDFASLHEFTNVSEVCISTNHTSRRGSRHTIARICSRPLASRARP